LDQGGDALRYVTVKTPRLLENFRQPTSKLSRKL
jgi:hypothetical protein